jgi:glycosidase
MPVTLTLTVGPEHLLDRAWVYWTDDGSDPEGALGQARNGQAAALECSGVEWDTLVWGYVRTFTGSIPAAQGGRVVRYRITASDGQSEVFADNGSYYAYFVDSDPPPAWAKDAVIYQIFADRFYSSAPDFPRIEGKPSLKCNGTLNGITSKLDYLADLGINCIWLTPIFPSPSYHGYDATSFFEINPRLGTLEDFRVLLDQAHARRIRILLDFVPNHWSDEHPTFVEAQELPDSPYRQWYTFRKWPNDYQTFFGVRNLPQINLRHPEARSHMLDAAKYWLEFGVDGFRVDYCIGPSPDFYAEFRRVTRSVKPDCWTFGEAIDPPDSQITFWGGMDGSLDFMLVEAFRAAFATQKWNARKFNDFLDRHETFFPESFSRPSFLDNHDMNRFLWMAGGDKRKLRLAALCQFGLGGAPVIYYGTEVGLSQNKDMRQGGFALHEEGRLPMPWDTRQDRDLLEFYTGLCHLRAAHPASREGKRTTIFCDDSILAFRRSNDRESLAVVLNFSARPVSTTLDIPERSLVYATSSDISAKPASSRMQIDLPPFGGLVLTSGE